MMQQDFLEHGPGVVNQSAGQSDGDVTKSGPPRHRQPTRALSVGIPRTAADMETWKTTDKEHTE